jgi:hypothetical protein
MTGRHNYRRKIMHTVPRPAGLGLLVYGLGTAIAFIGAGAPGGDYEGALVGDYIATSHFAPAFAFWYVGALAAVGLLVFGHGLRDLPSVGGLLEGLAIAATATSVVGAFVSGGLEVAMAEGGSAVRAGVPHPVIYTITEIGNLLAICSPALFVGVAALVLARRSALPGWLRGFCVVAGLCGILAPFYFTYFVYLLWTVVAGVFLIASRTTRPAAEPADSLV